MSLKKELTNTEDIDTAYEMLDEKYGKYLYGKESEEFYKDDKARKVHEIASLISLILIYIFGIASIFVTAIGVFPLSLILMSLTAGSTFIHIKLKKDEYLYI